MGYVAAHIDRAVSRDGNGIRESRVELNQGNFGQPIAYLRIVGIGEGRGSRPPPPVESELLLLPSASRDRRVGLCGITARVRASARYSDRFDLTGPSQWTKSMPG